jgi:hypothetical protein
MQVLNIDQVATIIHKTARSIRNDRVRNPSSLPPFFTLAGSRRLLIKADDLEAWILCQTNSLDTHVSRNTKFKKMGRPTNSSKMKP